jgi:amidophosphoribosyltransferase
MQKGNKQMQAYNKEGFYNQAMDIAEDVPFNKLHEECGVFGIYDNTGETNVVQKTYMALFALQHRGQESCGIAVSDHGAVTLHKDLGLVPDVFTKEHLNGLGQGQIAIGHTRYSTTGQPYRFNAQPLLSRHFKGLMVLAHNGNLVNTAELKQTLENKGVTFQTTTDTEVICSVIIEEWLKTDTLAEALEIAMFRLRGAYSLVMCCDDKLIAARDPYGFRPLCIGRLGNAYLVASESCALECIGAKFVRDIQPGEIVVIDEEGIHSITTHCGRSKGGICIFEYIYFARPDSTIDGVSVHKARLRAGRLLAQDYPVDADVVIGVPDSGLDAALGYSLESGIPYGVGFIKNRYIARTFIQPTQGQRENSVKIKLNALRETVAGKRIVLVDDSIVRGTTSKRIVEILRDAGALEVHARIAAPPFKYSCYFGTDVDTPDNLIATKRSLEEIAKDINVDSLGYLKAEHFPEIIQECPLNYCEGCFSGKYPVKVPKQQLKDQEKYTFNISE